MPLQPVLITKTKETALNYLINLVSLYFGFCMSLAREFQYESKEGLPM
jgi:hypothetical protein